MGNFREMEVLSMDNVLLSDEVRRSQAWSERSGSMKVTPKQSIEREHE